MAEDIFKDLRAEVASFLENTKQFDERKEDIAESLARGIELCGYINPDMRRVSTEIGGLVSRYGKKYAQWLPIAKKIVPLQAQLKQLQKKKAPKEQVQKLEKQIDELDKQAKRYSDEIYAILEELTALKEKNATFSKEFNDI